MAGPTAIGIICKAPRPGHSKTRLAAVIGADAAAQLATCFLRDVARTIDDLPQRLACRGYAVYAPEGAETALRALLPAAFGLLLQADREFGNVLFGATREFLTAGHDGVVLVNGDSPTLPPSLLKQAVKTLRMPGDRMVLGPASDGGYYLIGLKALHRRLFAEIPWGTDVVARRTLERASEIGLETVCLPEWYDIDDAEALEWLRAELAGRSSRFRNGAAATATRAYLAAMTVAAK
jgi:uncharacterized protein